MAEAVEVHLLTNKKTYLKKRLSTAHTFAKKKIVKVNGNSGSIVWVSDPFHTVSVKWGMRWPFRTKDTALRALIRSIAAWKETASSISNLVSLTGIICNLLP